jgi:polysaccharide export outer membrane protein
LASAAVSGAGSAQNPPAIRTEPYLIGIGDVLTVAVWKNEELTVTVPVRPDGRISLPLVSEVEVAGRTPETVRALLTTSYQEYITSPSVSVVVEEINSRKIFIMGEVQSSGVYDLVQPTRLLQALAMAGGLTDFAKKDQIVVLREEGGSERRTVVSIKDIQTGRRLDVNMRLQPGDTIIVP